MEKQPHRASDKTTLNGYAAEDIEPDSTILKIICPELTPNAIQGTLGAGISSGNLTIKDLDGNDIVVPITTSNHIVATWGGAPGQRVPPLIRKGEPVEIYKLSNQDKYFWRETRLGREFRTTDRMQFEISAAPTAGQEKNDNNTYTGIVDSANKMFQFKTSQANGEVCAWNIGGDLAAGTFFVSDNDELGHGNRLIFDTGAVSGSPSLHMNISSGVTIKMLNGDLFISAPKRIFVNAGDRIIFNSPLTVFNLEKTGTIIMNAANVAIDAAGSFVAKAAAIGLNGAVKCGGFLVAAAARISSITNGGPGGSYTAPSVDNAIETPVNSPNNSPDTSTSGSPYQT